MKIVITTTKTFLPDEPPIETAVKEKVMVYDYIHDEIVEVEAWVAEVPDIYRLAIYLEHELIIIPKQEGETYQMVEIYNDYRE